MRQNKMFLIQEGLGWDFFSYFFTFLFLTQFRTENVWHKFMIALLM